MAKPCADCVDVSLRPEQMHGTCMSNSVWANSLGLQGRNLLGRSPHSTLDKRVNAEARHRFTTNVEEHRSLWRFANPLVKQATEHLDGMGPKRTGGPLVS